MAKAAERKPAGKPTQKRTHLTVKQAKLIKGIAEGKTKRRAGIEAGYTGTPETISVSVSEVLKKPNVQDALQQAIEALGLTPERAIAPVVEALTATKAVVMGKESTEGFVDVQPDYQVRLQASDRARDILGIGKQQIPQGNTFNFVNVAKDDKASFGL